jgi:hypothetical protein
MRRCGQRPNANGNVVVCSTVALVYGVGRCWSLALGGSAHTAGAIQASGHYNTHPLRIRYDAIRPNPHVFFTVVRLLLRSAIYRYLTSPIESKGTTLIPKNA